jgi:hypothetical protein
VVSHLIHDPFQITFYQPYLLTLYGATDPEARVQFPALPEKKVVGLERGPLSLVNTTEELLLSRNRQYGRRDPSR